ncbi:hypothetical protein BKA81DRAFT_87005 [Phyllosticta paracitricarpa]|uniref:Uncharacterized protein n=2 Tax=Phyllosticta TaxID=121621 RepID=A0ABR1M1B9_9PEZI
MAWLIATHVDSNACARHRIPGVHGRTCRCRRCCPRGTSDYQTTAWMRSATGSSSACPAEAQAQTARGSAAWRALARMTSVQDCLSFGVLFLLFLSWASSPDGQTVSAPLSQRLQISQQARHPSLYRQPNPSPSRQHVLILDSAVREAVSLLDWLRAPSARLTSLLPHPICLKHLANTSPRCSTPAAYAWQRVFAAYHFSRFAFRHIVRRFWLHTGEPANLVCPHRRHQCSMAWPRGCLPDGWMRGWMRG